MISGSVLYSDSVLFGEKDSVSMMVTLFRWERVADDLERLRSRDRLRSEGYSLRRRGSSCGTCRLTGVRFRALERTVRLEEVDGRGEFGGDN